MERGVSYAFAARWARQSCTCASTASLGFGIVILEGAWGWNGRAASAACYPGSRAYSVSRRGRRAWIPAPL